MDHRVTARAGAGRAPARPARFDIVMFGRGFGADWESANVEGAPVWSGLPVDRVRVVRRHLLPLPAAMRAQSLFIPLREKDIVRLPRTAWGLVPPTPIVAMLGNKLDFARYGRAHNLTELSPTTWLAGETPQFPVVIKRTDLHAGQGIRICTDAAALEETLRTPDFAGHPYVLQAYMPGPEYTLHAIVAGGEIAWHAAYENPTTPDTVRRPRDDDMTYPVALSAVDLSRVAALLKPVRYDGPVNIDFKRDEGGAVRVLEINPRFGGTLFRPQNHADLKAALATLIAKASWMPDAARAQ